MGRGWLSSELPSNFAYSIKQIQANQLSSILPEISGDYSRVPNKRPPRLLSFLLCESNS